MGDPLPAEFPTYSLGDVALVNGMELELTLLGQSATDPATSDAVRRLREAGAEIGRLMQGLSLKYGMEGSSAVLMIQLAERWNADARHFAAGAALEWNIRLADEMVRVEPGLVRSLLNDALGMAVRISSKRPLQINCRIEDGQGVFEIAAQDVHVSAGTINSHLTYWAALGRLAERNHGSMRPSVLSLSGSFPMRLSFPLDPAKP
jgi:hypothetical protein